MLTQGAQHNARPPTTSYPLTRLDQVLGGNADGPLLLLLQLRLAQDLLQAGVQATLGETCVNAVSGSSRSHITLG